MMNTGLTMIKMKARSHAGSFAAHPTYGTVDSYGVNKKAVSGHIHGLLTRNNGESTRIYGADGETRTLTMLPSGDFESPASTIPPHRPVRMS